MRRGPLLVIALLLAGAGLASLGLLLRIPPTPRTVVLVTIDTLRADRVGAYGRSPSITPRIDALAAGGAVFEQAWAVAPITVTSHATMLTGLLPSQHGLRTNHPRHLLAPRDRRTWSTIAEALRGAGCRTAAFVSASVLRADRTGLDAGFDVYDDVEPAKPGAIHESERRGADTVARAAEWIRTTEGPAFLWVHLFDPHAPYDAPLPFGAGAAEAATARGYDAEVAYADHCVGRLLDALAESGRGDAVVAVVADHGEGLGEHGEATHGFLLHEATLRVPLVVSAPGSVGAGTRRADPVSTRDLAPTLLALARVAIPEGMPDTPLFGPRAAEPAPVYAETLYGHEAFRWAQAFAVRVGPWKLVDAGPDVFECDLASDPGERSSVRLDAADLSAAPARPRPLPLEDALDLARRAATGPGGPVGEEAPSVSAGGYFGGGAGGGVVLDPGENRRLPGPYARIGDLALLEAGQSLLGAGAAERALEQFDAWARRDPPNPQAQNWRGRALLRAGRPGEAAAAFRAAFDLGWSAPECVEKALQASALTSDPGEAARGLAFAETARGRNVAATGMSSLLEAALHLVRNDRGRARDCLERAKSFPRTPDLERGIEQTERLLDAPPR
jgi:arylsulfatase A-like enzyme